jgi:PKD repeat protein
MLKKLTAIIITITLTLGIIFNSTTHIFCQETRTIKIIDTKTSSNSIELGNQFNPIPSGGYHFTVNITLEGATNNLYIYQIAVKFDRSKIRCISAWINKNDLNFVFSRYKDLTFIQPAFIDNNGGYVVLGASLIGDRNVNVSRGLLCQINFTAIKTGESSIELIPTDEKPYDTFLANIPDHYYEYIDFTPQSFTCKVYASKTPPIASFSFNPSNPKANQSVTFDASESYDPDGEIIKYIWDFGDGNSLNTTEPTITHNFKSSGVYPVKLTVQDDSNRTDSMCKEVQVGEPPIVKFTIQPTETLPNQTVIFDASESFDPDGEIISYYWDFGDGNRTTADTSLITHVFQKKGVFTVNLTVYDNEGLHNSTSREVFVGKRPLPSFTYVAQAVEDYYIVRFDASSSSAGEDDSYITYYVWDFGDYSTAETNSPKIDHIYTSGEYIVNLTVYDNNGLYNSTSQTIKIEAKIENPQENNVEIYVATGIALIIILITTTIILKKKRVTSR